jgi:hypothetical protein
MQREKTALGYFVTNIFLLQKLLFRNPSTFTWIGFDNKYTGRKKMSFSDFFLKSAALCKM